MKARLVSPLSLTVAGILSVVSPTWAASLYSVTDLGEVYVDGMNSSGQVVGTSSQGAFVYSNGQMTYIGPLAPTAISDNGLVTGVYRPNPSSDAHAFLYNNGQITDLGTLAPYTRSTGYSVNNNGQVAGIAGQFSDSRAFLYSNGQITDLGTLGGPTAIAYAINNNGQVTGTASYCPSYVCTRAFIYSNGQMTDLGILGGFSGYSYGYGISNNGQVTGTALYGIFHAFLYNNGKMTDLGVLRLPGPYIESGGLSVNDKGQVVGYVGSLDAEGPFFDTEIGFLYSDGVMKNLYDLVDPNSVVSFKTSEAIAINDNGQILWTGSPGYAQPPHSYLLTPIPVPEPTTFVLLGTGLLAVLVIGVRLNPAVR